MQKSLQTGGVEHHMMAYFNREESNRIYLNAYGQLYFIDLSSLNQTNNSVVRHGIEKLPVVEIAGNMKNGLQKRDENGISFTSWQTLTDSEREELQKEKRRKSTYKTALCKLFRENNTCPYGDECFFAHGDHELRLPPQAHPKYKTQLCKKFSMWNYCPYGSRCQYIHQRINNVNVDMLHTKRNSGETVHKDYALPSFLQFTRRFITERVNKNFESPFSLENQCGGFCNSSANTGFCCGQQQKQALEGSISLKPNYYGYNETQSHDTEAITNNMISDQLNEHFNNLNLENNDNIFSRSCFSRIISS